MKFHLSNFCNEEFISYPIVTHGILLITQTPFFVCFFGVFGHDPYILSGHLTSLLCDLFLCYRLKLLMTVEQSCASWENGVALCFVWCTGHLTCFFQWDPGHYAYSEDWWAWTPFLLNTQTADLVSTLVLVLDPNDQISFSIGSRWSNYKFYSSDCNYFLNVFSFSPNHLNRALYLNTDWDWKAILSCWVS